MGKVSTTGTETCFVRLATDRGWSAESSTDRRFCNFIRQRQDKIHLLGTLFAFRDIQSVRQS